MSIKKHGLGRGLEALLNTSRAQEDLYRIEALPSTKGTPETLHQLPIHKLQRGQFQPRKDMSHVLLQELAESIKAQGLIQPLVVRALDQHQFEIIAGERRWRACQMLKMEKIPCIIKEMDDITAMAIALIENIQREDLNVMDQAVALARLVEHCDMTHQEVAIAVGKSRSSVTNLIRLNSLHSDVKKLLENNDLEMGHARALLPLEGLQQLKAAHHIIAKEMTVREAEAYIQSLGSIKKEQKEKTMDPDLLKMQDVLSEQLGTKVFVQHTKSGYGKLVINYDTLEHLDGILTRFN